MQSQSNNFLELTEVKLMRMKELKQAIKVLEAEYEMLKKYTIESYFIDNVNFTTSRGLVLASYTKYNVSRFNQTKFKDTFPDYFLMFSETKEEAKFLLK